MAENGNALNQLIMLGLAAVPPGPAAPEGLVALVGQHGAIQNGIQVPEAPVVQGPAPGAAADAVGGGGGGQIWDLVGWDGGGGGGQMWVVGGVQVVAAGVGHIAGAGGAAPVAAAAAAGGLGPDGDAAAAVAAAVHELPALSDSDGDDHDSVAFSDDELPPLGSEDLSDHHDGSEAGDLIDTEDEMPDLTSGNEEGDEEDRVCFMGGSDDGTDTEDGLLDEDGTVDIHQMWIYIRGFP